MIIYQQFEYFITKLPFPQKNYKFKSLYQFNKLAYFMTLFIGILQKKFTK